MADGLVEVVDSFVYLGSMIDSSGVSRGEILRWIGLARTCMQQLEKRIRKSGFRLGTKIRLYQTYIVPACYMGVKRGPLRNTCVPAWMRLICGRYTRF